MKKRMESLFFIAVAVLVIFSLRFALGNCERSEHEYKYAGSLNLEEETKQVADEPEKTEEQEETEETEADDVDDTEDNDETSDSNNDSNTGNSNGSGGGDGSGDMPGGTTVRARPTPTPELPEPSQTPEPLLTPEPTEKPIAEPTEEPEDKIESIKCSWPDKDSLVYGKSIPIDTMVVTAVYESGREEEISSDDYQITGLRATVCGKHKLTVIYEDFECKLTYTVANYIVEITYDWYSQDLCYKGEAITDDVLTVYAEMADGSEEEIPFGDYDLSGVDNQLIDEEQEFTIRYKGFEVSGTCTFYIWTVTVHNIYCSDAGYQDIVHSVVGEAQEVGYNQRIKALGLGSEKKYNGDTYVLKKEELFADGRKKVLPYNVRSREYDIHIYRYFVLE